MHDITYSLHSYTKPVISMERGLNSDSSFLGDGFPTDLHCITNTEFFKKRLKTVLFDHAYC